MLRTNFRRSRAEWLSLVLVTFVGCNCTCRGGATANTSGVSSTPVVVTGSPANRATSSGGTILVTPTQAGTTTPATAGGTGATPATGGTAGGSGWATGSVAPGGPGATGRGTAGAGGGVSPGTPVDSHTGLPTNPSDVVKPGTPGTGRAPDSNGSTIGIPDAGAPIDAGARGTGSGTGTVKPPPLRPSGAGLEAPDLSGGKPKPPPLAPTATVAPTRLPPPINQRP